MTELSKDYFTNNRKKLIASIDKVGLIIVPGNGLMQRSADTTYPFRQDSNLYYLTGIEEPCSTLVINTITNEEWLMLPLRQGIHAVFDGATDIKKLRDRSGIDDIIDESEGWQRLKKMRNTVWHAPLKPKPHIYDMYTNPHRAQVMDKARRIFGNSAYDIRPNLTSLRVLKSPEEIVEISKAVDITHTSLNIVINDLVQYANEQSIEAELTRQFQKLGASGHAYQPIVAGGLASCTLHYIANNAELKKGDMLLFDVGAEVNNYAADISRTVVYGQPPTTRQTEVIAAVAQAQKEIIQQLKPGLSWKDLSELSDKAVATKLVQLQLIPKSYQKSDIRKFFPHAVSHFLGLDVHDVGDYAQPLAVGMVITIEPGIYSASEAIGVRIEDDVVITNNGATILGSAGSTLI